MIVTLILTLRRRLYHCGDTFAKTKIFFDTLTIVTEDKITTKTRTKPNLSSYHI